MCRCSRRFCHGCLVQALLLVLMTCALIVLSSHANRSDVTTVKPNTKGLVMCRFRADRLVLYRSPRRTVHPPTSSDNFHHLHQNIRSSVTCDFLLTQNACPPVGDSFGDPYGRLFWQPIKLNDIKWNFEKFLVGPDGKPVMRWYPGVSMSTVRDDIRRYLLGSGSDEAFN